MNTASWSEQKVGVHRDPLSDTTTMADKTGFEAVCHEVGANLYQFLNYFELRSLETATTNVVRQGHWKRMVERVLPPFVLESLSKSQPKQILRNYYYIKSIASNYLGSPPVNLPVSTTLRESIKHAHTTDFFVKLVVDNFVQFEGMVKFVPEVHRNRRGRAVGMKMTGTFVSDDTVQLHINHTRIGLVVIGEEQRYFRHRHWKELRPSLVHYNLESDQVGQIFHYPLLPRWARDQGYCSKVHLEPKEADVEGGPFRRLYGTNFAMLYFGNPLAVGLVIFFKTFVDEPGDDESLVGQHGDDDDESSYDSEFAGSDIEFH